MTNASTTPEPFDLDQELADTAGWDEEETGSPESPDDTAADRAGDSTGDSAGEMDLAER